MLTMNAAASPVHHRGGGAARPLSPVRSPPPPPPTATLDASSSSSSSSHFRPLVVDELDGPDRLLLRPGSPPSALLLGGDAARIKGSDVVKPRRSSSASGKMFGIIGPLDRTAQRSGASSSGEDGGVVHACPCCRRYVPGSPSSTATTSSQAQAQAASSPSPSPSSSPSHPSSDDKENAPRRSASPDSVVAQEEEDSGLLGSLRLSVGKGGGGGGHPPSSSSEGGGGGGASDSGYAIRDVLARGWVHKKGTGKDWLGSRSWKPRWAVLATAAVSGYDVDVPLLLVYWYSSSERPSNVINLHGTVVMPVDRYRTEKKAVEWNTFTFEVVHAHGGNDNEGDGAAAAADGCRVTRTFSVPEKERNEWVFAINAALREYERRGNKFRSDEAAREARAAAAAASIITCAPCGIEVEKERRGEDDESATVNSEAAVASVSSFVVPPGRGRGRDVDDLRRRPLSPDRRPSSPPPGGSPRSSFSKPPLSPRPSPPGGAGGSRPPLSPRSPPLSPRGSSAVLLKPPLSPRMVMPRESMASRRGLLRGIAANRDAARQHASASTNANANAAADNQAPLSPSARGVNANSNANADTAIATALSSMSSAMSSLTYSRSSDVGMDDSCPLAGLDISLPGVDDLDQAEDTTTTRLETAPHLEALPEASP